jgi:uncharacterized OB-fold protein
MFIWRDMSQKEKEGDFNRCPKCGRTMHVLFHVRICPVCDEKTDEKEKAVYADIRKPRKSNCGF